jgi:diaminopimelate decarboxylase
VITTELTETLRPNHKLCASVPAGYLLCGEKYMLAPHIWPISSTTIDSRLQIGGCDVAALAREYGTPLYLFDEATIRAACQTYKTAFAHAYAGETIVHYAGKALLNTAIAQIMHTEGMGLDVVSGGELFVALHAGIPASRIHLHGNAKPRAELIQALEAGIAQIVVDNLDELELLATLTAQRTPPLEIALRLAPDVAPDTHQHIQTGQATSKFGLPLAALDTAATRILAASGLQLTSLHCHLGSQIFQEAPYAQAIAVLLDCAVQLRDRHGLAIKEINPGGGLGVPYIAEQSLPDVNSYAASLAQAMTKGCAVRGLPLMRLAVEPGRSIVARAGVAVYSIISSKPLPVGSGAATRFLHVDGGMADNIRPALYQARYTALLPERVDALQSDTVHIAGRYCESGDILLRDIAFPAALPGDLVAFAATGAYTLSMASNYNLTLRPAVVFVADGTARIVQRRETYADLVARDM